MLNEVLVLVIHATMCAFMCGVIWIVQVVHYPLFALVGKAGYADYQRAHMQRITWIVLPVMGLELLSGLYLFVVTDESLLYGLNLTGLAVIWTSTAVWQVPAHQRLLNEFSISAHRTLVRSNWVRTMLWTARTLMLVYLVLQIVSK